jgi:hypothetical protein
LRGCNSKGNQYNRDSEAKSFRDVVELLFDGGGFLKHYWLLHWVNSELRIDSSRSSA